MIEIIIKSIIFSIAGISAGLLFMGLGRKYTARMQRRLGPPFWQAYIDVIKCLSRQSISHHFIQDLGSIMGLGGLAAGVLFIPWAGHLPFDSNGALLILMYLLPIGYLGMAMGVSATGNPLAPVGISRALYLMVGYEVPFATIVMAFILKFGTTSLSQVATIQQSIGFWGWNIFTMPIGFLAAEIALQGMLGERPFDMMIAPAEIASGPMVELSGKFLGMAFMQHAAAIFIETGIIVNLFLGGATNIFTFLIKGFAVFLLALTANNIYGRYRIEQGVNVLWKSAGVLAIIQLIINLI